MLVKMNHILVVFYVILIYQVMMQNILAQNETFSTDLSLSETNKSCINDNTSITDNKCDLVTTEDTTDILIEMENTSSILDSVDTENVSISTDELGNGTEISPIDTTTVESEVNTKQFPETTTEPVSTTVEMVEEARPIANEICTCDLIMNSCDINCCCDVDCTENDRLAFSGCHIRTQYDFDPRHCYQTHFLYHNNTELKIVRNKDGLFCIVKDNLPARFMYKNQKIVTTLHDFNKVHRKRRVFFWPTDNINHPVFEPFISYRAGQIIWNVVNKTLTPFGLPMRITSSLCQTSKTVYYLKDWSGMCSQVVTDDNCENHPELIAATFYKGFMVVAVPKLINESHTDHFKEGCPANVCIQVNVFLCTELNSQISTNQSLLDDCTEVSDIQSSVYNANTRSCQNVVKQVTYKVYHNGTDGITKICAYVWLTNMTIFTELSQKFIVSFHWTKDAGKPFHRSGNPGYIVGKPVMSGRKVTQILDIEGEIDKEAIEVNEDSAEWLSIAGAMKNGRCDLEQKNGHIYRQSVTFGEDRWSSCKVFVSPLNFSSPTSCTTMHKTVIRLLAGNAIENVTTAKEFNLYIATFGDSKVEETSDWVQMILESVPSFISSSSNQKRDWFLICKSIITSVHIDIMFAHVGSLANPQAKILGAVFRFGTPHDVTFTCSSLHCTDEIEQQFSIVSSVTFIDVTKPAITEFAEPPVYEIKLPHDFFYPFFSNSLVLLPNKMFLIVISFILFKM